MSYYNYNKIYFIQTADAENPKMGRQSWVISSPSKEKAEALLVEEGWIDKDEKVIISSERVEHMVDTCELMDGKTYIKMHN